jgi:hypothetical protein
LIQRSGKTSPTDLKAQNHLGLASSDVRKTVATLQTRGISGSSNSSNTVQSGDGLPTRANIFDPDGARIEITEPLPAVAPVVERAAQKQ